MTVHREGQGSLMQCVITPALPYMPWTNEQIAAETDRQVGEQDSLQYIIGRYSWHPVELCLRVELLAV